MIKDTKATWSSRLAAYSYRLVKIVRGKKSYKFSGPTQLVKIKNLYSMKLPKYLSKTNQLAGAVATLQYANGPKEVYVIVVNDSKAAARKKGIKIPSASQYLKATIGQLRGSLTGVVVSKTNTEKTAQGVSKHQVEVTGMMKTHKILYQIAIVESSTHLFKIVAWTLEANRKTAGADLKAMIHSFRQLTPWK